MNIISVEAIRRALVLTRKKKRRTVFFLLLHIFHSSPHSEVRRSDTKGGTTIKPMRLMAEPKESPLNQSHSPLMKIKAGAHCKSRYGLMY